MENQKIVHIIRGQERAAECTDEPLDHGKHMSSRQAFGIHGKWSMRKAQTLPTYTQLIQEWWVMG